MVGLARGHPPRKVWHPLVGQRDGAKGLQHQPGRGSRGASAERQGIWLWGLLEAAEGGIVALPTI